MSLAAPLAGPAVGDTANYAAVVESSEGLTGEEVRRRSVQFGRNALPDTSSHPARLVIKKLWAPIPWMLEAAIGLQLVLGEYVGATIILVLLLFNAALGFFQEARAQKTLAALKSRLALTASIRRDGVWKDCQLGREQRRREITAAIAGTTKQI